MRIAAIAIFGLSVVGRANAFEVDAGVYLCTVDQRAGIGGVHLESGDLPSTFLDATPSGIFRIEIRRGPGFTIVELRYEGPNASHHAWHTPNAVLHSIYRGDGRNFGAAEDQAFLRIGPDL